MTDRHRRRRTAAQPESETPRPRHRNWCRPSRLPPRWKRLPNSRTGCCARWPRWRICANAPSARSPTRAPMASPDLPATCWRSPTTCTARWRRSVLNCGRQADAGVKALIEGVELTERELIKVLEKNGVTKFSPVGEKFDPNVHQAMYEVAECRAAGRQRGAGHPGRLHDRRPRVAAGAGGGGQRRAESAAGLRQRQSARTARRR